MKTKAKYTFLIVIVVLILGVLGFIYQRNTTQAGLCQKAENTGWAPVMGIGPIGCDGQLLKDDSPLIDRSRDKSGYTCYCHTPNTCWNGRDCVPLNK